jgi:hypothetical protein
MGRRSTRFKIVFFSALMAGFIVIQYSWVNSLQKESSKEFKSQIISAIHETAINIPAQELTAAGLANRLHQSFLSRGLGNIRFEFSIGSDDDHFASPGFREKLKDNSSHLVLYYEPPPKAAFGFWNFDARQKTSTGLWTVVIPFWKTIILKDMAWTITGSVLLTIMILVLFWYVLIWGERRQQLFYKNRSNAIKNMILQLETPLSTVSVATEALRNARVMHDPGKTNYFKQVITEQSRQMNEQVEKIFRELE